MKKVYVVLSRTGTGPSKFIGLATRAEFTHSSIALVPCRHKLYSYARRRLHNFLVAGFLREDIDKFVFALYPDAPCAVYEIEVSNEGYNKMADIIALFEKKYSKCTYSFTGMLTSQIGIKRNLKYKYTCAQFVATLLEASGDVALPKHPSLMKPMDLANLPEAKLVYSGNIKNIRFKSDKSLKQIIYT